MYSSQASVAHMRQQRSGAAEQLQV